MPDEPLFPRAEQAVALLDALPERARLLVVADADTDGVASAALLTRSLQRIGRRFAVRLTRRRDPVFFERLVEEGHDLVITADFGAGDIERFEKARLPTIVLDHHRPAKDGTGATLVHVNPHLVGEDGSRTASGAAVSLVFAQALLAAHGRSSGGLLGYALLGAHGDRYHGGSQHEGLHGRLHRQAEAEAARTDGPPPSLTRQPGPTLAEGPLMDTLTGSLDPFVLRAHTDPDGVRAALEALGAPADSPLGSLDEDARRRFASWLSLELLDQGAEPGMVRQLLGPRFIVPGLGGLDLGTVATLVDTACRQGEPQRALVGLLGTDVDRRPLHEGVARYEETIRVVLEGAVRRRRLPPLGPAGLVRIEAGMYAGPITDRIMAWLPHGQRPVVALGPMESDTTKGPAVKVSLRARPVADGPRWRLDEAARLAAGSAGGVGGGHALAAGAIVPAAQEARFLERIKAILEDQAGGAKGDTAAQEESEGDAA